LRTAYAYAFALYYIAFSQVKMPNTPIQVAICDLKHAASDSASFQPRVRRPAPSKIHQWADPMRVHAPLTFDNGWHLGAAFWTVVISALNLASPVRAAT
jgi:hypothetical protein